jgi:hypothetical protein
MAFFDHSSPVGRSGTTDRREDASAPGPETPVQSPSSLKGKAGSGLGGLGELQKQQGTSAPTLRPKKIGVIGQGIQGKTLATEALLGDDQKTLLRKAATLDASKEIDPQLADEISRANQAALDQAIALSLPKARLVEKRTHLDPTPAEVDKTAKSHGVQSRPLFVDGVVVGYVFGGPPNSERKPNAMLMCSHKAGVIDRSARFSAPEGLSLSVSELPKIREVTANSKAVANEFYGDFRKDGSEAASFPVRNYLLSGNMGTHSADDIAKRTRELHDSGKSNSDFIWLKPSAEVPLSAIARALGSRYQKLSGKVYEGLEPDRAKL